MPGYKPTPAEGAPVITREQFDTPDFSYPGKLAVNVKTFTDEAFTKKHNLAAPILKWEQVIERPDRKFADGNPATNYNSVFLQGFDGSPAWKGGEADQLAEAYEEICGIDMLPDTEGADEFVGHWFRFKSVKVEGTEKVYRQIPIEYLGPDFKYEGAVTTIGGVNGAATAAPEPDPNADTDALPAVLGFLAGMSEEDVRGGKALTSLKDQDSLKDVQTVLGMSLRGGLVKPKAKLVDRLVEAGHITINDDGIIERAE